MANAKNRTAPWEEQLAQAEREGKVIETGEFFKFRNHGDHCVGRLIEIQQPRGKMKSPVAILQMDGVLRPVGISGNMEGLINTSLIDHIISIWYVADKDVKQPQPMKVYRIVDHADRFPTSLRATGSEAVNDLPF